MTTAVVDNLVVTVDDVLGFPGIPPTTSPTIIQLYIDSGKEIADEYLNNSFEDDDGNVVIPNAITLGLYVWIREEMKARPAGVVYRKAGDLAERYLTGESNISADVKRYWTTFRHMPLPEVTDEEDVSMLIAEGA